MAIVLLYHPYNTLTLNPIHRLLLTDNSNNPLHPHKTVHKVSPPPQAPQTLSSNIPNAEESRRKNGNVRQCPVTVANPAKSRFPGSELVFLLTNSVWIQIPVHVCTAHPLVMNARSQWQGNNGHFIMLQKTNFVGYKLLP